MLSVRVTAAGAVFVVCLSFLTAPARACDDRFIKKCEKASAAAAAADEAASEPAARRGSAKRVKVVTSRTRHARLIKRTHAPRFASRSAPRLVLASATERPVALRSESPLARRFRGFIDPQPIAQNTFEALRKPQLIALDFDAVAIIPPVDATNAAPATETPAPAAPIAAATTPKQDKLAKPVQMELASAQSRPVTLADLAPVKPAQAETAAIAAPVIVSEAPAPAPQPSQFPVHGLVLALCGALGAASALRFIVGA